MSFKFSQPIGSPSPPCTQDCTSRATACHTYCPKYQIYEKQKQEFESHRGNPAESPYHSDRFNLTRASIVKNATVFKARSKGKYHNH